MKWTAPERLTLDGSEYLVDEWSLSRLSPEALPALEAAITKRIEFMRSERDHLQALMAQEQEQAIALHREYKQVLEECKAASERMPTDKWGLFSGAFTSDALRHQILGPYHKRLNEIAEEGKHLELWSRPRGQFFHPGRHPECLVFGEANGDAARLDGLRPRADLCEYRATTKTQRALVEHLRKEERHKAALVRASAEIQKRKRAAERDAKRCRAEQEKKDRDQRKRDRLQALIAAAAATADQTRKQAERLRSGLTDQQSCPYCDRKLEPNVHVDHIYPVSKGGRSVTRNLVRVCVECNLKKGSLTLTQFIKEHGLDREAIEQRLSDLDKDF